MFWDQFWPALLATFVGVAAGVPAALYVERLRTGQAARARHKRTREVASQVATSLRYNQIAVAGLIANLDRGAFSLTSAIDVATYDMFRADIATLFPQPEMRGSLARNYAEFARLATTSDLYRDMSTKVALDPSDTGFRILDGIRSSLRQQAEAVLGLHLPSLLAAVITLSGGAEPPVPENVPMGVVVDTGDGNDG